MTKQRSTFGKRDREKAKAAKAQAKRARREERSDEPVAPVARDDDPLTDAELVERLEALHAAFDDDRLSFDDFDAQRTELVERLAARMANDKG